MVAVKLKSLETAPKLNAVSKPVVAAKPVTASASKLSPALSTPPKSVSAPVVSKPALKITALSKGPVISPKVETLAKRATEDVAVKPGSAPVGILSAIKKVGRAIDPTAKNSALGGVVRMGVGALPGGGAIMGALDVGAKIKSSIAKPGVRMDGSTTPATTKETPALRLESPPAPAISSGPPTMESLKTAGKSPMLWLGIGGAVLLVLFIARK